LATRAEAGIVRSRFAFRASGASPGSARNANDNASAMNVFFAGLGTETNSFSAIPTAEAAFARGQRRGEAVFGSRGMYGEMARALRDLVAAEGGVVSPGLFAWA
jgi:hypothetical protein